MPWYFDKASHKPWLKNLESWVRAMRNILLNDNNNQRIDKISYSKEATLSLKQMIADLVAFVSIQGMNIEEDGMVVKKFLGSLDKTYKRIDNQSLAEEKLKASLILSNEEWEREIDTAEQHPYLWGQIRCLLNWSHNDLDTFKEYTRKLIELLNSINDNSLAYYSAILVLVPKCWEESNRLYQYNKDRDNSIKRYMRELTKEKQVYGGNIKILIDNWISNYSDMPVKNFLERLVADKIKSSASWIQCIIKIQQFLMRHGISVSFARMVILSWLSVRLAIAIALILYLFILEIFAMKMVLLLRNLNFTIPKVKNMSMRSYWRKIVINI